MTRVQQLVGAAVVVLAVAACGGTAPTQPADPAVDAGSSVVAPLERATEVAHQADQRTADLEGMLEEMGP